MSRCTWECAGRRRVSNQVAPDSTWLSKATQSLQNLHPRDSKSQDNDERAVCRGGGCQICCLKNLTPYLPLENNETIRAQRIRLVNCNCCSVSLIIRTTLLLSPYSNFTDLLSLMLRQPNGRDISLPSQIWDLLKRIIGLRRTESISSSYHEYEANSSRHIMIV